MQVTLPPVAVLPTYAAQVEKHYKAGQQTEKDFYAAHAANVKATVHPEYRLNRAEQSQREKQCLKAKLQTLFPIGTAVVQYGYRVKPARYMNVVVKFTASGYPVLDNGDTLKFENWDNQNGIRICARTKSSSFGHDTRNYQAVQWQEA
jgi:hypothetical protein